MIFFQIMHNKDTCFVSLFVFFILETSLETSSIMFSHSCSLYQSVAGRWQCSSVQMLRMTDEKQVIIKKRKHLTVLVNFIVFSRLHMQMRT